MKTPETGGASRPRRRRVALASATLLIAAVLTLSSTQSDAGVFSDVWAEAEHPLTQPDTIYARRLLESVRGAGGILCSAVDRSFESGNWSQRSGSLVATDFTDQQSTEVAQWIAKRRFDISVLNLARPALTSNDPCVRRIAARIAGNAEAADLHQRLRGELNSADTRARSGALFALGFAGRKEAASAIRERLSETDRAVRVAAIWALGRIEDEASSSALIGLLERNSDPEIRTAAAWALGRIHD